MIPKEKTASHSLQLRTSLGSSPRLSLKMFNGFLLALIFAIRCEDGKAQQSTRRSWHRSSQQEWKNISYLKYSSQVSISNQITVAAIFTHPAIGVHTDFRRIAYRRAVVCGRRRQRRAAGRTPANGREFCNIPVLLQWSYNSFLIPSRIPHPSDSSVRPSRID
jgi:hypothetical protein